MVGAMFGPSTGGPGNPASVGGPGGHFITLIRYLCRKRGEKPIWQLPRGKKQLRKKLDDARKALGRQEPRKKVQISRGKKVHETNSKKEKQKPYVYEALFASQGQLPFRRYSNTIAW